MDLTDDELMVRSGAGDAAAFDELVRRWEGSVGRLARRLAPSPADADDLRQEVFLRVLKAQGGYRPGAAFFTWLYQITLNASRDFRRRRAVRQSRPLAPTDQPGHLADVDRLEQEETKSQIEAALATLPERLREVLVLKHYGGLTFAEVAEVTGLPLSTVKSRMQAALVAVRKELRKQGFEFDLRDKGKRP